MGRKQDKKSKKVQQRQLREGEIPNLRSSSILVFIAGLITIYTIIPDNWWALILYAVIVGGALLGYNISHDRKLRDK